MNMLKKLIVSIAVLLLLQISIQAQKGSFSLSLGSSTGFAIINAQNYKAQYKPGFGAGMSTLYNTTSKSSVTLKINYLSIASKLNNLPSLGWTSIKLGYKSYFNNSQIFGFGDGGINIFSGRNFNSNSSFGLGSGVGYSIPVGKNGNIDVVPSFDILLGNPINSTWLNFHLGYRLNIK
jgi:hypothetical protein